jgi:protein-S-isoprenylcysteine O-methyltransferase Ste14
MTFLHDPFFWALISMFGLVGAGTVVSGKKLGSYALFGFIIVAIFDLGRVILVLPTCPQPRLEAGGWQWAVGGVIFAIGVIFCIPALTIKPVTAPDKKMNLSTTGFYGIVRNPIYFGELLWCLGWAIMFRSIIGVALVPLWWAGLQFHIIIEEESLERELGQSYLEYKARVRGRIIPGLPI